MVDSLKKTQRLHLNRTTGNWKLTDDCDYLGFIKGTSALKIFFSGQPCKIQYFYIWVRWAKWLHSCFRPSGRVWNFSIQSWIVGRGGQKQIWDWEKVIWTRTLNPEEVWRWQQAEKWKLGLSYLKQDQEWESCSWIHSSASK